MLMMKYLKNFGIKEGYPNLRRIRGKLADFFALCRPFTLLGAFMAGFFLDILFSKPATDFSHSFLVGMVLAFLQAGGQACNQSLSEEVEIDKINKKLYRPTVSGRMGLKEAKAISILLSVAGVSLAFFLNLKYGLFSILIAFFAIAYTAPPFRMKKRFFLNNLWQGVARGFLPAVYVASVHEQYTFLAMLYGVVLTIWVTGAQATKDFSDMDGDRRFNIRTFPVVLGRERALFLMELLMAGGFVVLNLFVLVNCFPQTFYFLNVLAIPSALIIYALKKNLKFKYAENNLSWTIWYGTLGLFYMMPVLLL